LWLKHPGIQPDLYLVEFIMQKAVVVLTALISGSFALSLDDEDTKANAVNKVTAVLEEMKAQLEKEAASDDEVYEQMMCWCETNDKLKTKAIADNTQLLGQLEEFIPEAAAKIAQLQTEVKILKGDIADGTQELAEATALREKESGEFKSEEADTMVSISGVTKAIDALGAKMSSAFLEVQSVVDRQKLANLKGVTPEQQAKISAFLETKHRAPSSEIFGILKSMKESFEINLKDSQDDEKAAVGAYSDLKAGKDDEISAATDQKNTKEAQAAETVEKLAQAKEDKVTATETLEADEKFLADLKDRCGTFDADFAARKKMRSDEMAAVGEALSILTSDDARDQFSKSVAFTQVSMKRTLTRVAQPHYAGLLQAESAAMAQARTRASRLLLEQALALGSPRLSLLAQSVRSDVFAKIKVAIDEMVTQLKQEKKDDVKHRYFCIGELNQNEKQTDEAYDSKKELTTKIDDLELQIKNTDEEIANAKQEITDTQLQIKKASENREKENYDYQTTISDQKATQGILKKALQKLKDFYAFVQTDQVPPPPPADFKEYKKSGGASGVMMMIETIIEESVQTAADAVKAEQDAQTSYEKFVKDSNGAIDTLNEGISEKTSANADAKADHARAEADLKDTMSQLLELANYAEELHSQCDFTLKQFDTRQAAFTKEIEALQEAKMILSGMEV
jgi:hypothetical protein